MRCFIALAVLLFPAIAESAPDITKDLKEEKRTESERLIGSWKLVYMHMSGSDGNLADGMRIEMVFSESQITYILKGIPQNNAVAKYTIDAAVRPKRIDIQPPQFKGGPSEWSRAIYELKDDELVIVMRMELSNPGKASERPAAMDEVGEPDRPIVTLSLKREKP